jgi:hypothetical protein
LVAATAAALLAMTVGVGSASARPAGKNPLSKDGVIYACYKVKGKERGSLRVVRHPRACRKLRGWHRTAWSAVDSFGVSGQHGAAGTAGGNGGAGPAGPQGAPGQPGEAGQPGVAGTVEQSLIETIQTQSLQIDELTDEVTTLTGQLTGLVSNVAGLEGDVGGLEGAVGSLTGDVTLLGETVEDVCGQVSDVTEQTDLLAGVIGGISLDTILAVLLEVPPLPAALGEYECT